MKVAFIVDYYPELGSGIEFSGAEVSISLLSGALARERLKVVMVDPIKRAPGRKLQPAWRVNNPVWHLYSAWKIWGSLRDKGVDIIHVQGKNVLVGAFLANLLLHKPLIVTVRDYRLLCDLGMCLLDGDQICDIWQYLTKDVPRFVEEYKKSSLVSLLKAYIVGAYQLLQRPFYLLLLRLADKVICISHAQEEIYHRKGVNNTQVIYNVGYIDISRQERQNQVFFGGKYSLGKGAKILEEIVPRFLRKYPAWKVVFVGRGRPVISNPRCVVMGPVSYSRYKEILSKSAMAIVPSVWPEPFGRAALDALIVGTPVVVSGRGGLPEIVEAGVTGEVAKLNPDEFFQKVELVAKGHNKYQANILAREASLHQKFFSRPIEQHIALYQSLL